MGKTLVVREEIANRQFVVTKRTPKGPVQNVIDIWSGMSDVEIRKAVQAGVDINCFEANPEKGDEVRENAWNNLNRFAVNLIDTEQRINPTTKTELVSISGAAIPQANAPKIDKALQKKGLIVDLVQQHGLNFEEATAFVSASVEELKELDYKKLGKVFKLKGQFGVQKVYDTLHK